MKQKEKTALTRMRIMDAAMQEFGEHGYSEFTMNALCSKHHISKGLIYHNFSGKKELYLKCVEKCFSEMISYMQSSGEIFDMYQYLELRNQYFSQNPILARIFFEALLQPPQEALAELTETKKELEKFNHQIYCKAVSKLKLRDGITQEDALEYCEMMQKMFNDYFSSPDYVGKGLEVQMAEHEQWLQKMLDFMLYGIAKEGIA